MVRWAGYRRVSTGDQAAGGSMPAQEDGIRRFVAARGGELVALYEDQYSARGADGRAGFLAMVRDAQEGRFDHVVVHKFDRFARNRRDAVVYKALLRKAGVRVHSALEPVDPEAPAGMLFEGMLEVFAEYFSANLAQEVRKGLAQRARMGLQVGSAPYGYRLRGGLLEPTEDLPVARLVLETYLSGTATDMDIVRMLAARGVARRSPDGTVGPVTRDVVRSILTSPVYAGQIRYRGQTLPGRHQAAVSPAQFEAVTALRRRFFHAPRANRRSPRVYPFAGLVRCGRCGGPMSSSYAERHGRGYQTYRCTNRATGKAVCDQPAVRAPVVRAAVWPFLERMAMPPTLLAEAAARSDPALRAARARASADAAAERLRRARLLFLEGALGEADWARERARAAGEEARAAAVAGSAAATAADPADFATAAAIMARCDGAEQKLLARLLLDRIVLDGPSVARVDPSPLGAWLLPPSSPAA